MGCGYSILDQNVRHGVRTGAIVWLGAEGHQQHWPRPRILNGVRHSGRNCEPHGLSFRHTDVLQCSALADSDEAWPHDHQNFRTPFVVVITPDAAGFGENHMRVALGRHKLPGYWLDHPTPPITEKRNILDYHLGSHHRNTVATVEGLSQLLFCQSASQFWSNSPLTDAVLFWQGLASILGTGFSSALPAGSRQG